MRWLVALVVLGGLFIIASIAKGVYADWLWFDSLGYAGVYRTRIVTQVGLFLLGGLVFLAFFGGNLLLALRFAPATHPHIVYGEVEFEVSRRTLTISLVVAALLLTLSFAGAMSGQWESFLQFTHRTTVGQVDPTFGRDVGFYLFSLPFLGFLQGWAVGTIMLTAIAVTIVYVAVFGAKSFGVRLSGGINAHLSLVLTLLLALFGLGYWLGRFELNYSTHGTVFGATYADLYARLPALNILLGLVAVVIAVTLANLALRRVRLPIVAVGVWLIAAVLLTVVYPNVIQRLQVQPNELVREQPYIERNIQFTRFAYGLDRIEEQLYPATGTVTATEIEENPETIQNVRIWDHRPLLETYNQAQSLRPLYRFSDVDIDRYTINGSYRQVMISPRELIIGNLQRTARTWVNERLQFTHGYGVVMNPVNEVVEEGLPNYFLRNIPVQGTPTLQRPELYYGEHTDHAVVVKTQAPEFDYPQAGTNATTVFQGTAGVRLNSWIRRILFAWQFADPNLVLSQQLTSESLLLYHRNVRDRLQTLAPFLRFDDDPYIVVADSRLFWIEDAYTTSSRFPYAQPSSQGFNYIRNSVKVVVDAYDGTTTFYVADPDEPVARTYGKIFPGMFQPLDAMPQSLRGHLRYPEKLFRTQVDLYRLYHLRDPRTFYNKEDLWDIPTELIDSQPQAMEPYYVIMRLPGEPQPEFILIQPLTPAGRQNTIAWIAARMDGANYGHLLTFRFPTDSLIFGPAQVEARIDQTPVISQQFTLWNQSGSRVVRGNLLMIPIGNTIIFVEPIYLRAESNQLPELKRVVVASGTSIAMEATLEQALATLTGQAPMRGPAPSQPPPAQVETALEVDLLRQAKEAYDRAQERLRAGDFAGYGQEIARLGDLLSQLQQGSPR